MRRWHCEGIQTKAHTLRQILINAFIHHKIHTLLHSDTLTSRSTNALPYTQRTHPTHTQTHTHTPTHPHTHTHPLFSNVHINTDAIFQRRALFGAIFFCP